MGDVDGVGASAATSSGKRPKRKVAIIFGYIGERYCGLQWNHLPNYPTVEEELLRALHRTNMISEENYSQEKVQQKLNWERASRTDKGVHALRNVISLNLMLPHAKGSASEYDTVEAKRLLMSVLPPDIIVYEIIPVTRSFNAYMMCGARTYEYYIPTFAFMSNREYCTKYFPPSIAPSQPTLEEVGFLNHKTNIGESKVAHGEGIRVLGKKRPRDDGGNVESAVAVENVSGEDPKPIDAGEELLKSCPGPDTPDGESNSDETPRKFHDGLFEKMLVFRTIPEDTMREVARYRITSEDLEETRRIFHLYEGTHSYHNFTPGGKASDPSSVRYITSVTVSDPFVIDPADPSLQAALQQWTPSRFYSPDDELLTHEGEKVDGDVEQHRLQMRERMLGIYRVPTESESGSGVGVSNGLEVVRIELNGQSFLFNQIRKMIGAVSSMRVAGLPPAYLRDHFLNRSVRCGTPMAPANGLFLSYLDFQRYNYRLGRIQLEGDNGRGKDGIYVDRVDQGAVEEFRRKIVAVVLRNEMVTDAIGRWMRSLRHVLRLACNIELP
uniref:Pseudouridine synthase I TruA alpha/beta domain-containing protein n=1 Tax=Trypanosoma congolense (strain IL3000) TaxID=1068625 RepID=G0UVQ9_TRYCI|nr:conserved hypothetical protein [Trypanosoma congolense IL3000]